MRLVFRGRFPLWPVLLVAVMAGLAVVAAQATQPSPLSSLNTKQGLFRPAIGLCANAGLLESRGGGCTHGVDVFPQKTSTTPSGIAASIGSGFFCEGDGTSGKRVQAIYAYNATSRYSELTQTFIDSASFVNQIFMKSAGRNGSGRMVRFVTDSACSLSVIPIKITGSLDFANIEYNLMAKGYNRADRLYLIWIDEPGTSGVGNMYPDDRYGAINNNNTGPRYAAAWNGVWGGGVLAHELGHALGAVQPTAPMHSLKGHCTDEWDLMCYDDSWQRPDLPPNQMTTPCTNQADDFYLDCGGDNYFNAGTVPTTNWLATHWNIGTSPFLAPTAPYPKLQLHGQLLPGKAVLSWSQPTGSLALKNYEVYRFESGVVPMATNSPPRLLGTTDQTSFTDTTLETGAQGVPQPYSYGFGYFVVGYTADRFAVRSANGLMAFSGLTAASTTDNTSLDCYTRTTYLYRGGSLVGHLEFIGVTPATLVYYDCLHSARLGSKTGSSPLDFSLQSQADVLQLAPFVTSDTVGLTYRLSVEYPLEDMFDNNRN